jgi:hypothetical protein
MTVPCMQIAGETPEGSETYRILSSRLCQPAVHRNAVTGPSEDFTKRRQKMAVFMNYPYKCNSVDVAHIF